MCEITITQQADRLAVASPYNPGFPPSAKALGGRWHPETKTWRFDPRDEDRVRGLCREVYGTDGSGDVPTVTVRIVVDDDNLESDQTSWFVAGREVARVYDRDGGARLAEGVVVVSGKLFSCGSRRHPTLGIEDGTVLELRDVPVAAAEAAQRDAPGWYQVAVVSQEDVDRGALRAEGRRLLARLREIEGALGEMIIGVQ